MNTVFFSDAKVFGAFSIYKTIFWYAKINLEEILKEQNIISEG